jgi:WD40 repeat protein/serine/threonine protein kinase
VVQCALWHQRSLRGERTHPWPRASHDSSAAGQREHARGQNQGRELCGQGHIGDTLSGHHPIRVLRSRGWEGGLLRGREPTAWAHARPMTHVMALPAGTELVGEYRIERVLGAGGFGITYLAQELALSREVTIKEYFPGDFAARIGSHDAVPRSQDCAGDYQWGLDRFISEAQILARFDHRNIVRVYRYFRANNTGYMVLNFEEGQSLKSWLKSLGRAPRQKEIDRFLAPLLDALELIHKEDFLHRDIAPDNIIIRPDGAPVLIDFGSARGDIARQSRTVSALVKPGYSPYEQYAECGKQQGPWTDIYALAATLYHAVTGKRPPDAPSRVVKDELVPAREAALSSYRSGFLAAIDRALALDIDKRPQSVAEWRGPLLAPEPRQPGWLRRTMRGRAVTAEGGSAAATRKAAQPASGDVPPPPDAPGDQGRLLDYIDRLKRQSSPPNGQIPQAAPPAPAIDPAPAAAMAEKASAGLRDRARKAVPPRPAVEKPAVRRKPRPRRAQSAAPGRWWPLAMKLAIGVVIATVAVSLQDRVPGISGSSPPTMTTQAPGVRHGTGVPTTTGTLREVERSRQLGVHPGGVSALAFTADGRQIVTTGADGTIKLWDAESGAMVHSIELAAAPATSLAIAGRRAVSGHADGNVILWDLDRGERIAQVRRNAASVWSVGFLGDPNRFAAASHDWAVSVWDARSASAPALVIEAHEGPAQAVAFSGRGPYLASGGADRLVKLWDAISGAPIRTYRGHRDYVTALAFSTDGRILASASFDGVIRLWSTSSPRLFRTLARHSGRVTSLAFSPAGDLLVSAGDDGSIRLWDFRRARQVRSLGESPAPLKAVAFAPDGRRLAASGDSGALRVWEIALALQSP